MKLLFTLTLFSLSFYCNAQITLSEDSIPSNLFPYSGLRNDVHIDRLNNYWIAFEKAGLGKFDGNNWIAYDSSNGALPVNKVLYVTSDSLNNIYAGTSVGISIFNGITWQQFNSNNSPLPLSGVTTIEINGNEIWAGTKKGLFLYDGLSWTGYSTLNSGIINDTVNCISIGKNGEIWTGTRRGISKFYQNNWTNYGVGFNEIDYYGINDLAVNGNNELWVLNGPHSVYFLDTNSNSFVSIKTILPSTEFGCHKLTITASAKNIESDGVNIYLTSNDFLALRYMSPILIKINLQHIMQYILFDSLDYYIANAANFDYHNSRYALIFPYNLVNSKLYHIDLSVIPFHPFPTAIIEPANLNINQVNARINNDGEMHWNPADNSTGIYEVPACSGKNTIYASALWLGGYDQNNQLHTACQTYKQQGASDFWPGPLDTINATIDSTTVAQYDRLWKVNRTDIDSFIVNYNNPNYTIPQVILDWPAHGTGNYSRSLAPFVDKNSDGIYNPSDGDYPQIDGDQEIWWVFNDAYKNHTESKGTAFGLEIQAKAYAYNCAAPTIDNDVINYTTFYQYKIINRSDTTYHGLYIGFWCDIELGDASDDLVQCDVLSHTGFGYNGDSLDETGNGYGLNPPIQNITILKGPIADPGDGIDNNYNGIIDEPGETNSMNHFFYYFPTNDPCCGNPQVDIDYYEYMDAHWKDNMPMTYGGDARGGNLAAQVPGTNIPCNFMFPGTTDSTFSANWTMPTGGIQPTDMRMLLSSGKFSIAPGEIRTIDFAYITTRDSFIFPNFSYNHNQVAKIQNWFDHDLLASCPPRMPVVNTINEEPMFIFPNPSFNQITLVDIKIENDYTYSITDITGKICFQSKLIKKEIDISKLSSGLYFIRIENNNETKQAKFIKLK